MLSPEEREMRRLARLEGHRGLAACVKLWLELVQDPNADMPLRLRATENLADRFGLPRRNELEADLGVSDSQIVREMLEGFRAAARRDDAGDVINGNGSERLLQYGRGVWGGLWEIDTGPSGESREGEGGRSSDVPPEILTEAREHGAELYLCAKYPDHFILGYCRTLGPSGMPEFLPRVQSGERWASKWEFVSRLIGGYCSWKDRVAEKSRQMLVSHLTCCCSLHSLLFRPGYSAVFGSADAGLVDDGGENSTPDSLFGRVRFAYQYLPDWLRNFLPVYFSKNRIICPRNESYIVGDSRKGNIGRGGTYEEGTIDEAAYIEFGEASLASLRPAAKRINLVSTPNGRRNMFGRVRFDRESGFAIETYHWTDHPERAIGKWRDQAGFWRSPWYDAKTRDLTDERRAREYDLDYTTSLSGLVYKEFRVIAPPLGQVVPAGELPFNPALPLGIGIDFGHARKTGAILVQQVGPRLHVIADFEGKHRDSGSNARDLAALVRAVGFTRPLSHELLELLPDPAAQHDETGSGHSILSYYSAVGFKNWRFPMLSGPQSVRLGIALVREKLIAGEILISDRCTSLIDRIQDYRYPTDPRTEDIRGDNPVHDMASHIMDALRYAVTSLFTAAGPNPEDDFIHVGETSLSASDPMLDDDPDDDRAPRGPGRMIPSMRLRGGGH
jgi:hypothetical protein